MPIISGNTEKRTEGYFRLEWRLADQRTQMMSRSRPFVVPVSIDQLNDVFEVQDEIAEAVVQRAGARVRAAGIGVGSAHGRPHVTLAMTHLYFDWNWAAAETEARRAIELDPRFADAVMIMAVQAAALGCWSEAQERIQAALRLDPIKTVMQRLAATFFYGAGQYPDAEIGFQRLLEQAILQINSEQDPALRLAVSCAVLWADGKMQESDSALGSLIAGYGDKHAYWVAMVFAYRNDRDWAFSWRERAYRQKESDLILLIGEPFLANLMSDSRYKPFLRKMNLPVRDDVAD